VHAIGFRQLRSCSDNRLSVHTHSLCLIMAVFISALYSLSYGHYSRRHAHPKAECSSRRVAQTNECKPRSPRRHVGSGESRVFSGSADIDTCAVDGSSGSRLPPISAYRSPATASRQMLVRLVINGHRRRRLAAVSILRSACSGMKSIVVDGLRGACWDGRVPAMAEETKSAVSWLAELLCRFDARGAFGYILQTDRLGHGWYIGATLAHPLGKSTIRCRCGTGDGLRRNHVASLRFRNWRPEYERFALSYYSDVV
jgi:hypothetical protein